MLQKFLALLGTGRPHSMLLFAILAVLAVFRPEIAEAHAPPHATYRCRNISRLDLLSDRCRCTFSIGPVTLYNVQKPCELICDDLRVKTVVFAGPLDITRTLLYIFPMRS